MIIRRLRKPLQPGEVFAKTGKSGCRDSNPQLLVGDAKEKPIPG